MNEIIAKVNMIEEMVGHLEAMSVSKLMVRVKALKDKATTVGGFEREDSLLGSIARMEKHIKCLENAQKSIVQMVSEISENFGATLGVVRVEVVDLSAKLTSP